MNPMAYYRMTPIEGRYKRVMMKMGKVNYLSIYCPVRDKEAMHMLT